MAAASRRPASSSAPRLPRPKAHHSTFSAPASGSRNAGVFFALALANGADINEGSGYWHNTPLMQTARSGDTDTVRLLLDAGANIHACFRQSCFAPSPTPGYNALHQLWDRSNSGKLYADMRDFLLRAGIQPAD